MLGAQQMVIVVVNSHHHHPLCSAECGVCFKHLLCLLATRHICRRGGHAFIVSSFFYFFPQYLLNTTANLGE